MLSLRHRRIAWLVALLAVLAAALISRITATRYLQSEAAVRHTMAVRVAIDETLSLLTDAETGQRGYLLTGDIEFLSPHERAERELPRQLRELQRLTSGETAAKQIEQLAHDKLDELAEAIALVHAGETDSAFAIVSEGRGRRLMESIRKLCEQMDARETAKLADSERSAAAFEQRAWLACGAALLLAIAVVWISMLVSRRDMADAERVRNQLLSSERALRILAENATDLIRIVNPDRSLSYVSASSFALLGYRPDEMLELPYGTLVHEDEREAAQAVAAHVRETGQPGEPFVHRMRTKSGEYRWFETRVHPILDEVGQPGRVHLSSRDVTLQRQAERELIDSERRWRVLSEASFEGVGIARDGKIVDSNETFARWFGRTQRELIGVDELSLFAPQDREQVVWQNRRLDTMFEARMLRADGTAFPVEVRSRDAMFRGMPVRIAVIRDVTEKKQREAELKAQAELLRALSLRDELTSLYNRRGFMELSISLLRRLARIQDTACLFFADLNGMKVINDELGHEVGDRAIVAAGKVLASVFRDSDIVARLGGDEFAALAPNCDLDGAAALRERVQAAVTAFNAGSRERYRLSISMGAAYYDPRYPVSIEALMEQADANMYEEKRKTRSSVPDDRLSQHSQRLVLVDKA